MLPTPETAQIERSEALARLISEDILAHDGWIGFDRFMHRALYEPGIGYYSSNHEKFGAKGDFVTAPLLGALFAQCLANQAMQFFDQSGSRDIYEFGAGNGRLCHDMLLALDNDRSPLNRYWIVETSAGLIQQQQQTIAALPKELADKVQWLDRLPDEINGLVIGNELLDAFPCKRFQVNAYGEFDELGVTRENNQFLWQASSQKPIHLAGVGELIPGYQSEILPQADAWIRSVGERLEYGALLLVDYGFARNEFYHPDRVAGTLMCHYRHRSHSDPFLWPGLQDITTHVDFTAVAQAAAEVGLETRGYCDQGNFLMSCGILDILAKQSNLGNLPPQAMLERTTELKKLTLPHEMGELFKVIALGRNIDFPLIGFSRKNQPMRLDL